MPLYPRVHSVEAGPPFTLRLGFADGSSGSVDLAGVIRGGPGLFLPLQDPAFFARVAVDHESGTIVWPNGIDLDPDVLYEMAHGIVAS